MGAKSCKTPKYFDFKRKLWEFQELCHLMKHAKYNTRGAMFPIRVWTMACSCEFVIMFRENYIRENYISHHLCLLCRTKVIEKCMWCVCQNSWVELYTSYLELTLEHYFNGWNKIRGLSFGVNILCIEEHLKNMSMNGFSIL
jgi:hypothetical protein